MRYRACLILIIMLNSHILFAKGYVYDYNQNCSKVYEHFMAMRFAEGNRLLLQEIKTNPYNLMATYLGNYEDCLVLLFNGDKNDYQQRSQHLEERLRLLSQGDEKAPWYRLCKAGINLQWALVNMRMGENLKAATLFRKSYLLLKENHELFPSFEYNNVYLGLEKAALGAIPDEYKWIASMFGMKGDVKKGVGMLSAFVQHHSTGDLLSNEAMAYYCYLRFYLLSQREEVWNFINKGAFDTQNNLLNTFIQANLALNYRKADAAMQILKEGQKNAEYKKYAIFDFEAGNALFYKLDPACIGYYQRFLNQYKGRIFVKDAWQKLSLIYYLQQDKKQASYCRGEAIKQGTTQVDADKQALRACRNETWPDMSLLQARLLTDGGFYKDALGKMSGKTETDYSNMGDRLEYLFRLGRIYDELGDDQRALDHYTQAIKLGKERPEQFAARSALQMGFIYERKTQNAKAIASYQLALSMHGHDFQSSIDQQAKAGVNRLSQ
ncbi:MAG: hypothetical protein BGO69_11995 [Bacteroidetes bacterium 46-16]|nr:MAG: hypothetical protein BGO69_11995 [Bacteroidetes bacterium 46-16]